ncbi:MAG: Vancomycin B-type resistance protein VanW [Deltaproteobacteria bacterium]|nr:Vancomycin B-type resistance protein VanW [Deltaproteobacteria bacterium]
MELRDASGLSLWLRQVKVAGLSARRLGRWLVDDGFAAPARTTPPPAWPVHRIHVPIARAGADLRLEAGKRHNVRLAATAFHGITLSPSAPLSFWRALGPATAARGFAWGMELRSGCAVPAIGGGLCLISNALFTLAVELGWHILERHGHSMALGDPAALDATVAFPHIDLRIAPREGSAVLDVRVRGDVLVVAARHDAPRLRVELERLQHDDGARRDTRIRRRVHDERALIEDTVIVDDHQRIPAALRTCLDCGETACRARIELPEPAR